MTSLDVAVSTPDGTCPATLHLPAGGGPRPAVILYPDAAGARDTFRAMADRLAGLGYVTLLPDVYYRAGAWAPFDVATVFSDPDERARVMAMAGSLAPDASLRDAGAFLDFLDGRDEVGPGPVGTTGYCMGGRIALTVAGRFGDRVGAAASFHGGRLAPEDDPAGVHLLTDDVHATTYVAAAENDDSCPPDQLDRLGQAWTDAGVRHTIETYPAQHGFAVPDNATFDEAASERHWQAMTDLYGAALR